MVSDTTWLTFDEAAARLRISRDSVRRMALRKRWSKRAGNDGRARIGVPAEWLAARQTAGQAAGADGGAATGQTAGHAEGRDARPAERQEDPRVAVLEAEVRLLRELADNFRGERDKWQAQAERLAASLPARRGWWPWRRSA
jgi:hypothetical protein